MVNFIGLFSPRQAKINSLIRNPVKLILKVKDLIPKVNSIMASGGVMDNSTKGNKSIEEATKILSEMQALCLPKEFSDYLTQVGQNKIQIPIFLNKITRAQTKIDNVNYTIKNVGKAEQRLISEFEKTLGILDELSIIWWVTIKSKNIKKSFETGDNGKNLYLKRLYEFMENLDKKEEGILTNYTKIKKDLRIADDLYNYIGEELIIPSETKEKIIHLELENMKNALNEIVKLKPKEKIEYSKNKNDFDNSKKIIEKNFEGKKTNPGIKKIWNLYIKKHDYSVSKTVKEIWDALADSFKKVGKI